MNMLRSIREKKGLTIGQLAARASIPTRILAEYEEGRQPIPLPHAKLIAKVPCLHQVREFGRNLFSTVQFREVYFAVISNIWIVSLTRLLFPFPARRDFLERQFDLFEAASE